MKSPVSRIPLGLKVRQRRRRRGCSLGQRQAKTEGSPRDLSNDGFSRRFGRELTEISLKFLGSAMHMSMLLNVTDWAEGRRKERQHERGDFSERKKSSFLWRLAEVDRPRIGRDLCPWPCAPSPTNAPVQMSLPCAPLARLSPRWCSVRPRVPITLLGTVRDGREPRAGHR